MTHKNRITPSDFKLYGVFGFPLKHTLSPVMQQAAFDKLGLSSFYLALELAPNYFRRLMSMKENLLLDGFNLTIPHKQIVTPYLDSVSREAELIGAVNTVIRKGDRFVGENTDAYGFLKSLAEGARWKSKGKTALILGAGGASRAVVYALCQDGIRKIFILNRTVSKAKELVKSFKRKFPRVQFDARVLNTKTILGILSSTNIFVNTTSVGLKKTDAPLIPSAKFPKAKRNQLAVDLIYNPAQTPFLAAARRSGWKTLNGLGMLLHQGARSFELWTGKKAPVEVMRKALHGRIASVSL